MSNVRTENELRAEKTNRFYSLQRILCKNAWDLTEAERELAKVHTIRLNEINAELHELCTSAIR